MNLFEYLSRLRLSDITQGLREYLTRELDTPRARCAVTDAGSVLMSNKSSKLLLETILKYFSNTRHPYNLEKLQVLVVDFLGTSINSNVLQNSNCTVIQPDVYPVESGNPQRLVLSPGKHFDVAIVHGFDFIWHILPGLTCNDIESMLHYPELGQIPVVLLRTMPAKFVRAGANDAKTMLLEIIPSTVA